MEKCIISDSFIIHIYLLYTVYYFHWFHKSSEIITSIEDEAKKCDEIAITLQERIETNEHLRAQNERDIQERIQNELSELRGMIDKEKQERKVEDDEIVMA